jgi:hypothetical protein
METVERMKNQFRLEVFGPLAMYMHVADPACAAIIEKVIPLAKLLAFMTLDSQDSRILKQEFKKLNLKVDIITMENVEITPYPALPQVGNINVQHIGTQLDCHDSIRSYLNMFCGLHRILWCRINDSVADNAINSQVIDRLLGTNDSIRLYVNRVQPSIERQKLDQSQLTEYNCVRSRYNRNILPSISTQDFLPKGLLGVASEDSSSSVRQEIEQRIRNHKQMIEAIEKEIMTKRTLLEDLHNELNKLKHQKNDANTRLVIPKDLQRKIDNEKRKLADIQIKLSINMHQQKEKLFASYDECVESSLISIEKLLELNQDKGLSNIDRCVALNYKSEVNSALHIVSEKVTEARESLKQYQQCVKTAQLERHDVEKKKDSIEAKLNKIIDEKGGEQQFENLYKSVEEACPEISLVDLQAKVMFITDELNRIIENPEVLKRYKQLQEELMVVNQEFADLQVQFDSSHRDLQERSVSWCTDVRNIANRVNESFKVYMKDLGFQGEVSLLETGTFNNYEMRIKVSFRENTDVITLSGSRHSGGERAVSTIMYLMALQNLTT